MPPVVIGAAAAGAVAGALGLTTVTLFGSAILGGAAVSGGLALLSHALAPKPNFGSFGGGRSLIGTQRSDTRQLVRSAVQPAKWVLGRARLAGSLVYYDENITVSGEGSSERRSGTVELIIALCESPVDAVERVYVDGIAVDWYTSKSLGELPDLYESGTSGFARHLTEHERNFYYYRETNNRTVKQIWRVDFEDPSQSVNLGDLPADFYRLEGMASLDGVVYGLLRTAQSGLQFSLATIDISNPSNSARIQNPFPSSNDDPEPANYISTLPGPLFTYEGNLYLNDAGNIWEVDVSDPANSTFRGTVSNYGNTNLYLKGIMERDGMLTAISTVGSNNMWTLDIDDAENMSLASDSSWNLFDQTTEENIVDPHGLAVLDNMAFTISRHFSQNSSSVNAEFFRISRNNLRNNKDNELAIDFYLDGIPDDDPLEITSGSDILGDWTSSHKCTGKVLAHVKIDQPTYENASTRIWNRLPNLEFLVRGQKITWPGQDTAVWTDNAAALRYWWLRNRRGIPASAIDETSFTEAYDICEETPSGEKGKRYRMNGIVQSGDDHNTVEDEMDLAWSGEVIEANGKHWFRPGADRTPRFDITDDDVISRGPLALGPSLPERFNSLDMQLSQSDEADWISGGVNEFVDADQLAIDGRKLSRNLGSRAFVTNAEIAERLMRIEMEIGKLDKIIPITVYPRDNLELAGLLPTDRVTLTNTILGFDAVKFMVLGTEFNTADWSLTIILRESPDGLYD